MTGRRTIERTLDAWFVDGPSVMPDRLFDAVLDEVGRTQQRPFARLRLRLTEMNPRVRLFTVLAAALLAVVAGFALIGGGSQGPIAASPSPTAGSSLGSVLPTEIVGRWSGGSRSLPGLDAGAGTTLTFTEAGFELSQINDVPNPILRGAASATEVDQVLVSASVEGEACPVAAEGRYRWSLTPSDKTLTITADGDPCAARLGALVGTWLADACPDPDGLCLGGIDAGDHASQAFDPFVPEGGPWAPRYGALTYSVPAGWQNLADWPLQYDLEPVAAPDGTGIYVYSDVVVVSEEDPCSETPATDVGETAQEIADSLAAAPGLVTTEPAQTTVGALDAWQLDVSIDQSWTTTCPFSGGLPYRGMFTDRAPIDGFHWGVGPNVRLRLYLVDLGDGRAMMVDVRAPSQADFDAFLPDATTVVESFAFNL